MKAIKFTLITVLTLVSINSFATDFDCKSQETGLGYRVNSKTKTIVVFETTSKEIIAIHEFEKLITRFEGVTTSYSYANNHGIFMEVKIQDRKITGSFDDDEKLVCKKIKI